MMKTLPFSPSSTSIKQVMRHIILAFSIVLAASASAQNEGRWYNVELLVFKRLGAEAYTRETWPQNIELGYPDFYQYLKPGNSENFSLLPSAEYQLNGINYTLRKNENYSVLTHQSWRQQMDNKKKSPAIIINGGKSINGHKELEGYIKIYIARYLHVMTDLWLTQDIEGALGNWPRLPARPGNSSNTTSFNLTSYPVVTLTERRRMRSNELHYIDHPLIGVFILFTPIEE